MMGRGKADLSTKEARWTRTAARKAERERKERRGGRAGTHVGVQWEVQVPPELLDGAAAPVLEHVQVGPAPELYRKRK